MRIAKGVTRDEAAAILSVSNKTVSKWEISETYPDGALLVPIAKIFDAFGSITRHIR